MGCSGALGNDSPHGANSSPEAETPEPDPTENMTKTKLYEQKKMQKLIDVLLKYFLGLGLKNFPVVDDCLPLHREGC